MECGNVAKQLLEHFFEVKCSKTPEILPEKIQKWIQNNIQNESLSDSGGNTLLSTTFHKHGRILISHLSKTCHTSDYTLLLVEDQQALEKYQELQKQLTRRQFEMYHHLKDGERDLGTIARKMGISVRTAEGHKMHLKRIVGDV